MLNWLKNFFKKKYTKVTSLDGELYYIRELAVARFRERSTAGMGWLNPVTNEWYPFAFWKIRNGYEVAATDDEIARYRQAIADSE